MKKIVAYLLPISECEDSEEKSTACVSTLTTNGAAAEDEALPNDGAMKLEVTVADIQAQRIVAALMGVGDGMDAETNFARLLEKELEIAGPDAHDLFARIVLGVERELISRIYSECDRVKTRAASRLGINRNTLHKKLRQYHLAED